MVCRHVIFRKKKTIKIGRSKLKIGVLNSDFDHMFGLVNGFCDQKPERSEMNWPSVAI